MDQHRQSCGKEPAAGASMTSSSRDQDQDAAAEQPVDKDATADCRDSHVTATGKHTQRQDFCLGALSLIGVLSFSSLRYIQVARLSQRNRAAGWILSLIHI